MSISTSSPYPQAPYPHAPYQQAGFSFKSFFEADDVESFFKALPVEQEYIKQDEISVLVDALMDKDTHEKICLDMNNQYSRGVHNTEAIYEEVYNKPVEGNLISFDDPKLKKLTAMLPLKGMEKRLVGDIEKKSYGEPEELKSLEKLKGLGDATGAITNIDTKFYMFVGDEDKISNLYFGVVPCLDFDRSDPKSDLYARIYKLLRIAYDSIILGLSKHRAVDEWSKINNKMRDEYSKQVAMRRVVADTIRYEVRRLMVVDKSKAPQAFSKIYYKLRNIFGNSESMLAINFVNNVVQSYKNDNPDPRLKDMFKEDINKPIPAIVQYAEDENAIYKILELMKKYIGTYKFI